MCPSRDERVIDGCNNDGEDYIILMMKEGPST